MKTMSQGNVLNTIIASGIALEWSWCGRLFRPGDHIEGELRILVEKLSGLDCPATEHGFILRPHGICLHLCCFDVCLVGK